MSNIIIFTGTSRTDPGEFKDPDNKIHTSLRSIGAYQIANVLRKHNYSVQVVDNFPWLIKNNFNLVLDILKKFVSEETIWIGFSSTFFDNLIDSSKDSIFDNSLLLSDDQIKKIKECVMSLNDSVKFVLGGAKAWKKEASGIIDYYVEGYADTTVVDLTKYLQGKNPFFQFVKNLDHSRSVISDRGAHNFDFVNSAFHWHEDDCIFEKEALPIEISRGCIFRCSYCSYPLNGKSKLDYIKDPSILIDEFVRNYEMFGTTSYIYSDDTHNDSVDKLEFLYNKVYSKLPFKISFGSYLRLDLLRAHPQTIDLLKESGISSCFFGIESLNYESNKVVGKGARQEKIIETLEILREKWPNVFKQSGFIIGLPNDSETTVRNWMDIICSKDFPLDNITINPLHIFQHTGLDSYWFNDIEINFKKYGYEFLSNTNWINNVGLTKEAAWEIKKHYHGVLRSSYKNKLTWMTAARVNNIGLTMEEYNTYDDNTILQIRDNRILEYTRKLLS